MSRANAVEPNWQPQLIEPIGLIFDKDPGWPTDATELPGGVMLATRLPDDAVFIVRYGERQTLDRVVPELGDDLTKGFVLADDQVLVAGRPARRILVSLTARHRMIPGSGEPGPATLMLQELRLQGIPVLIGYRAPADSAVWIWTTLDRIVAGVRSR